MAFIVCNESFKNKFGSINFPSLLDRVVDSENLRNYYFICATNQLVNNFKLSLASKYYNRTGKPIVNTTVSNLESLIRRFFNFLKSNSTSRILSDAYRFLIFKEAFDKSQLNFFKQNDEKVSLFVIKWLSQIIFGLKEDGITYKNFDEELSTDSNTIVNLAKYLDTKILFESYQKLLDENNFYDIIDATYFATSWLRDNLSKQKNSNSNSTLPFIERDVNLIFIGFFDFKLPEIDFIGALGRYENPLAIFLDFDETNGPLFGNFNDLILNFKKQGLLAISVPESSEETNTNFLKKYLFNNLFGRIKDGLAERIRVCAVQNRYVEAKQIAKLCKYLIQIKGYRPSEICITTKNPQAYASLFREVFQEVGVPLNVTERFRLSSSPLVLSILAALNVVAKGFRFSDLRKVLLSFYFKFGKKNEFGEFIEIDIENFLDVATKMKVLGGEDFGGKTYWLRRFDNRLKAINNRISLLNSADYSDQMELSNLEKERIQVEKAKEDFFVLLNYFDFEQKNLTVNQFYDIIFNKIIINFGVLNALNKVVNNLCDSIVDLELYDKINRIEEVEKDSRALSKFLELLEEFTLLTNARYGEQKFSLTLLIELLKVLIFEERFQISKKPGYGVTITTIEQTRGIPYKVMILCGAIDGEIPRKYSPEKFLGKTLGKSEKRHFENERLEFFHFLTNNQELFNQNQRWTYIFYPKRDSKKEFVPSPFIFNLYDLIGPNKAHIHFDLTNPEFNSSLEGMDWVNIIASKVEMNLKLDSVTLETEDQSFYNDLRQIYFHSLEANFLNDKKLTAEAIDSFEKIFDHPISTSFLEEYKSCPYKFFVTRILNLQKSVIELELLLSDREKGEILHLIVANFYRLLAAESVKNSNFAKQIVIGDKVFHSIKLDKSKKTEYFELIEKITELILDKFNTDISLFQVDIDEFISKDPSRIGLVQLWLNYELRNSELGLLPTIFELSFGLGSKDHFKPIEIELSNDECIKLKGKIDRIDILPAESGIEYVIIDYKLSKSSVATLAKILDGYSFQLPLYAIAFQKLLKNNQVHSDSLLNLLYIIFRFYLSKNEYLPSKNQKSYNIIPLYVDKNSALTSEHKFRLSVKGIDLQDVFDAVKRAISRTVEDIKVLKSFSVEPSKSQNICNSCQFFGICKI